MKEKILVWRAELLEELEKALTREYLFSVNLNSKLLSDQLHKWKGSCAVLGMMDLANVLGKFESHFSDGKNTREAQGIFDQWISLLTENKSKL
jgi:HPt (histidine-containing phosphotransfer) domain-containing protein